MRWMMPVDEILKLESYDGYHATVAQVLPLKDLDWFHDLVREEMRAAGVNLVPVVVLGDQLFDGHHRVILALELGHEEMLVSDNTWDADIRTLVKHNGESVSMNELLKGTR